MLISVIIPCYNEGEVLRSTVSVIASQMAVQSDSVTLDGIEREWSRKIALRETRMAEALAGFRGPVAEVDYAALGEDWRAEIARAYAELGLQLTPHALEAMEREQAAAGRSPHRRHAQNYREFARA